MNLSRFDQLVAVVIDPETGQVTDAEARSPTAPLSSGHSVTSTVIVNDGFVAEVVSSTGFTITEVVPPTNGAMVA